MNLTSPSQVKAWCIANGFHPNRTLGQNFLVDRNSLDAMVEAAEISPGDRTLEVGPGLGVLTEALLARGAQVTAVEKDRRLAGRLFEALGRPAALRVIEADALDLEPAAWGEDAIDACVSNLPYAAGTRILLNWACHEQGPARFTVMVQEEVAERLAAAPGQQARGLSGIWAQLDYEVAIVRRVKPSCFWPRPEVGSAIVRLDRRACGLSGEARACFRELTRLAFSHRRKQLGATLREASGHLERDAAERERLLEAAGIPPRARAEQLDGEQWKALARAYAGNMA